MVCATPDTYTQWDGAHKTTRVHSIIANDLIAQVQDVPEPGTLALLALPVGAAGVLTMRRRRQSHSAA